MVTAKAAFDELNRQADTAFQASPEDGLFSLLAKKVFGCRCWRFMFRCAVPIILKIQRKWESEGEEAEVKANIRRAMDWHIVLMTVLLVAAYAVTFSLPSDAGWLGAITVLLCCAVSIYRLGEILSIFVQLHLKSGYQTEASTRAVLNTFWHYLEFTIAFATFYATAGRYAGDSFGDKCNFLTCPLNPLYFSIVTITTIGYGDYSPQTWQGKALVICEVFLGLFLIVMVVQRAISAGLNQSKDGSSTT